MYAGLPAADSGKVLDLRVELADEPEEWAVGLMGRETLGLDEGVLFVFEDERDRAFWMKDVLIPLDLVWMDASGVVMEITPNAPPCASPVCPQYLAGRPSRYVLEIAGGECCEIGFGGRCPARCETADCGSEGSAAMSEGQRKILIVRASLDVRGKPRLLGFRACRRVLGLRFMLCYRKQSLGGRGV
ncbi:MAG: DUF192 domain-containing protein [Nitrosarchaeum sp.]|nr:DUF192 domain-containing protein [Nitrosarchaeum sp.]